MKKWLLPTLLSGFFVFSLVFTTACNPDPAPAPSPVSNLDTTQWYIDTTRFYSLFNVVSGTSQGVILSGTSLNNSGGFKGSDFSITFHLSYIPAQGTFDIDCGNSSASSACIDITYNRMHYRPKAGVSTQLIADSLHQKAKIFLPATWFYSTVLPDQDSVVVSGTFYQQTY